MSKVNSYSLKGVKQEAYDLPKAYSRKLDMVLVSQVIRTYEDKVHVGLRRAKTRAEVLRTGKKLYKQKGTGGARHGSRRAPIFVGGGVAHGPRPIKSLMTVPAKMAKIALNMLIGEKARRGELVVVTGLSKVEKTKEAMTLLAKITGKEVVKKATFVTVGRVKAFDNLKSAKWNLFKDLTAYKAFIGGTLIIEKEAFKS